MIIKPLTHIIMNMHHMCASLYIVEDSRELARLLRGSAVSLDGKMGVGSLHFPFFIPCHLSEPYTFNCQQCNNTEEHQTEKQNKQMC